jgi:hypothetical protein
MTLRRGEDIRFGSHYVESLIWNMSGTVVRRATKLTLSLLMWYIYGVPCKARNFNVVYIYGLTFGKGESCLCLFDAQCFNTESMQKVILRHSCV